MHPASWVRLFVFGSAAIVGGLVVQESGVSARGQQSSQVEMAPAPMRVLVADPTDKFTRVVAPRELVARPKVATISVTYNGFSAAAQTAFQAAVDIWQAQITSSVPISIVANFTPLETGVLGSAGSNFVYRNFTNGTPSTFYPAALANKLAGTDLNPSEHDINANFSSSFSNWYFGTNSLTPAGQYDFFSVVLHEIGHGLGFSGSMDVSGGVGSYGLGSPSNPMVFDRFAVNGSLQFLIDTTLFANPSAALAAHLTGGSIFWNGAQGFAAAGGTRPKLYAPATWSSGSSFSHLDETTYPAGNANSLMTFAIGTAEAIHDPGPITRGIFTDMGWTTTSCSYTISPTTSSVGAAAGTGAVSVSTTTGCAWTATSNTSFLTITAGASGTGSGTVSYAVAANVGAARSGTLMIAGQTFTVSQSGTGTAPTLTLNRTTARYGIVNSGLSGQTSGQTFTLNQSGAGTVTWTAAASQPWLTVSPSSGTGTSSFTVSVTSNGLPASGTVTGTVTITAPASSNTPQTLTVTLVVYPSTATTTGPFGSLDTPAVNATGIAGALAVTGWALDDTEVGRIRITRARFGSEAPGPEIPVGDALFVIGARPDVETANPTVPFNYRAGFGYQLLTNMLPGGGNGTYTIFVYADDREGRTTLLGSRTVTMSNSTSIKPFGAIDSPAPGSTISGSAFDFYGWALTPNPKQIPTDGSTITIFIDGVSQGTVPYNLPRSDIATLFPGFTNTNGSLFRKPLNTTTFSNAVHTISVNVFDNAGVGEGIGSRYFQIQNSALMAGAAAAPRSLGSLRALQATHTLGGALLSSSPIRVVRGYQDDAPAESVSADSRGVRSVEAREQNRLVLRLTGDQSASDDSFAGYLVVGDELRPLPIGSTLDEQEGVFSWDPGPGFLGSYDLVFVRTERDGRREHSPVRVILRPKY